jgi:hypothetical protein
MTRAYAAVGRPKAAEAGFLSARAAAGSEARFREGRRDWAAIFNGNDRTSAVIEGARHFISQATIQSHRKLATEIVNAVSDGAAATQDDGLDLQDVGTHGGTIAEGLAGRQWVR